MSYLSIILVSCLATLSLASPVARQDSTSPCPWNYTYPFTMTAFSNGGDQVPLGLGRNGLGGAEYSLAATWSIDSDDMVTQIFTRDLGRMAAYNSAGNIIAVSAAVVDGGLLRFLPSDPNVVPANIYTELCDNTPDQYFLEANGSQDFSLCHSTTSDEVVVVLNAWAGGSCFNPATCISVAIHLIPQF